MKLLAPAKINLALEVLGKRDDGYHEVITVMQSIDLVDTVRLLPADDITLEADGPAAGGIPSDAADNLACRAAVALREAAGVTAGVSIELTKSIPAAAGLGGGSSNAAAVLRGLNRLWGLDWPAERLAELAAGLGSDVPFFLWCGTKLATGRGERIAPIPGVRIAHRDLVLFTSSVEIADKTRRLYGALQPTDFTDGSRTRDLFEAASQAPRYFNAFTRAVAEVVPPIGEAMALCRDAGLRVIVAGAGPSFFAPVHFSEVPASLLDALQARFDIHATPHRFIGEKDSLVIQDG